MNVKQCDICGSCESVKSLFNVSTIMLIIDDDYKGRQRVDRSYDLCDDCAELLEQQLIRMRTRIFLDKTPD